MDIKASLSTTPVLEGVPAATLAAIERIARPLTFEDGDVVYRLGDPARDIYVVVAGRLRFSIGVGNRPDASGSVMKPGDLLGWAALIEDQPRRIATATCLEDTTLIAIDGGQLLRILEADPRAGYQVMRRLCKMIAQSFMEQSALLNSA